MASQRLGFFLIGVSTFYILFFVLSLVDDSRAGLPAQTPKERSSFSNMYFAVTEL
jgi:hypothetical protein